jgi:uncharacterized protein YjdB
MQRPVILVMVAAAIAACSDGAGPAAPARSLHHLTAADTAGDTTPGHPRARPVASVTVLPAEDTVAVGDSASFFALILDGQGNVVTGARVRWRVADPTVARIEAVFGESVILRALRPGATILTARSKGRSGSARLVVLDSLPGGGGDSVASVTVSPPLDSVLVGDSAGFFATLRDANGNLLSRPVTWTVSDSTVALIEDAFGQSVQVRAVGTGSSLIIATSEGVSGSAVLVVGQSGGGADSVATVTVIPPIDSIAVGDSAGFSADLRDANGNFLTRPVTWTLSDSTVAVIESAFGQAVHLRAVSIGSTLITATSEGKSGSAVLVVGESGGGADSVATVTVIPPIDSIAVGDSSTFFADLRNAQGDFLTRPVAWTVSDSTVVQIEDVVGQSITLRGLRVGTSLVTATSEGKSGVGTAVVR